MKFTDVGAETQTPRHLSSFLNHPIIK